MSRNLPLKKMDEDCVSLMYGLLDIEEKTNESDLESNIKENKSVSAAADLMKKVIIKAIKSNYQSYKEAKDEKSKEKHLSSILRIFSNKIFWDDLKDKDKDKDKDEINKIKDDIKISVKKYIDLDKEERFSIYCLDICSKGSSWSSIKEEILDEGYFDYVSKEINKKLKDHKEITTTTTAKSIQTAYDPEGKITPRPGKPSVGLPELLKFLTKEVAGLFGKFKNGILDGIKWGSAMGAALIAGLGDFFKKAFDEVMMELGKDVELLLGAASDLVGDFLDFFSDFGTALGDIAADISKVIGDSLSDIMTELGDIAGGIEGEISNIAKDLENFAGSFAKDLDEALDNINPFS